VADDLHPDAAANFAQRAAELLQKLRPAEPLPSRNFHGPTPHIAAALGQNDIDKIGHLSDTDVAGEETARTGAAGDMMLALSGEDYREFVRLAQSLQRTRQLASSVALGTVKTLLFDWLLTTRAGAQEEDLPEYLIRSCRELVKRHTIVVPVHELFTESPHRLGRVEIRPISGEQIDKWLADLATQTPSLGDKISYIESRWRKRMQGRAASFCIIDAELRHARATALLHTEHALAALRLFSVGTLHPRARSTCVSWGREHLVREFTLSFGDNEPIASYEAMSLIGGPPSWALPDADFALFWKSGLEELSDLLSADSRSSLDDDILKGMLIYSRAALSSDVTEKLLHVFVMLESLLLKNDTEPVQAKLAERVAFIVGRDANERLAIEQTVKRSYGLRSKFVHHGAHIDDLQTVQALLHHAFYCFFGVLRNRANFEDRNALLDILERRKYA
jgi:hypothetical protein